VAANLADRFPALAKAARAAAQAPASLVVMLGEPTKSAGGDVTIPLAWARPGRPTVVAEIRGSGGSEASRTRIASDVLNRLRKDLVAER
jgi:hypothetical protein